MNEAKLESHLELIRARLREAESQVARLREELNQLAPPKPAPPERMGIY